MGRIRNRSQLLILVTLLLFIVISVVWIGAGYAEENQVNLEVLIFETQKGITEPGRMIFVWWIPLEYWENAFAQSPGISRADIDLFLSVFRPYTVMAVLDGASESSKKIKFKAEAEIRSTAQLIDSQGNAYAPLEKEDISTGATELLKKFKPMVEKMVGKSGKNFYFILFPSKNSRGQDLIAPTKEGTFMLRLAEREFKWRLPLSSLVPPKKCPVCGEVFSGAYKYCPWDGTGLVESE